MRRYVAYIPRWSMYVPRLLADATADMYPIEIDTSAHIALGKKGSPSPDLDDRPLVAAVRLRRA